MRRYESTPTDERLHAQAWTPREVLDDALSALITGQQFDDHAHQIALQEMVEAVRISGARAERLEHMIEELVPTRSLEPLVQTLQTLQGIDLIVAVTFATEVGDVRRFEGQPSTHGYLGLAPGERSMGDIVRRGGTTKASNGRVRHTLVRERLDLSSHIQDRKDEAISARAASAGVREIASGAQSRSTARYRQPAGPGKRPTGVCIAMARELVGFT